ncbi:MAG TPA: hypothetical protein VML55_12260 [Planctomycetaceae bacterium]|nr:hypothetical protein [Planctomycetaceae bacterium]
MPTDRTVGTSRDSEADLERMLRAYFASEMPPDLRRNTESPQSASGGELARRTGGDRPRASGRLGLTVMLASLMLASSALLWSPRAPSPGKNAASGVAGEAGGHATDPAGERHLPQEAGRLHGPVELRGRSDRGVPVESSDAEGRAGPSQEFPEFDIRIIPIDGDR